MSRGSSWGRWDLHVHTPASYEWRGQRRLRNIANEADRDSLMAEVVTAMNASGCVAVGVMDYWTFDGVKALRAYLRKMGAASLQPALFPGIELRMVSPGNFRLNMHVLLNPRLADEQLDAFKAQLLIANFDRPLVDANIIEYGRSRVTDERLRQLSLSREQVARDDAQALIAGSKTLEVTPDSVQRALKTFGIEDAVLMIPFDTSDGMAKIQFREHYNYPRELLAMEALFEVSSLDTRDAFVGIRTAGNEKFFDEFQSAIVHPKLAVRGSDAHRFADYGKSPHEKYTWLKAEPTFAGLLQACKEPANRSYIGVEPPKLEFVRRNPHLFVRGIEIRKGENAPEAARWFEGTSLELNDDLVAIIGRKGSGKSALADVVGFLGNTPNARYFSFLSDTRFRLPRDNKAASFEGRLTWAPGADAGDFVNIASESDVTAVERVKYLPQRYFEELCNDHVQGKDDLLQRELQKVIFSHLSSTEKQGTQSLEQLTELRSAVVQDRLRSNRQEIERVNAQILDVSDRVSDERAARLRRELDLIIEKLRVLKVQQPIVQAPPQSDVPEVAQANAEIKLIEEQLQKIANDATNAVAARDAALARLRRIAEARERLAVLRDAVQAAKATMQASLRELGIEFEQLVQFNVDVSRLDEVEASTKDALATVEAVLAPEGEHSLQVARVEPDRKLAELKATLDAPNRQYQEQLAKYADWERDWRGLLGNAEATGSFWSVWWELEAMPGLASELNELKHHRMTVAKRILADTKALANVRAELYRPVQELVGSDADIRTHLHVQFSVNLLFDAFADGIFDFVKQSTGSFVGQGQSAALVKSMLSAHDMSTEEGLERFLEELETALFYDVRSTERRPVNLKSILRSDKKPEQLLNYVFQLEYVQLVYGLSMGGVSLERLSPGQRGALLLIFYLLVDKENIPIVLDQPEENLDNETVFRLLVNVINKAKLHRQVIMITHNANLAVACDAEQIICCEMHRDDGNRISYQSGSIEQLEMNRVVVDVLEGTKRAFDNRRRKYA